MPRKPRVIVCLVVFFQHIYTCAVTSIIHSQYLQRKTPLNEGHGPSNVFLKVCCYFPSGLYVSVTGFTSTFVYPRGANYPAILSAGPTGFNQRDSPQFVARTTWQGKRCLHIGYHSLSNAYGQTLELPGVFTNVSKMH